MKKFIVILWVGWMVLFMNSCTDKNSVKGVKHVVVIGLDGWGAYSMPKANMPNVKK